MYCYYKCLLSNLRKEYTGIESSVILPGKRHLWALKIVMREKVLKHLYPFLEPLLTFKRVKSHNHDAQSDARSSIQGSWKIQAIQLITRKVANV